MYERVMVGLGFIFAGAFLMSLLTFDYRTVERVRPVWVSTGLAIVILYVIFGEPG